MNHPTDEKLSAFLEGDLGAAEKEAVATHLGECTRCSEALARLRRMVASLSELPELAPPPHLRVRILERLEAKEPWPARLRQWLSLPWLPLPTRVVGTLAVALVVVGVGLWLTPGEWHGILETSRRERDHGLESAGDAVRGIPETGRAGGEKAYFFADRAGRRLDEPDSEDWTRYAGKGVDLRGREFGRGLAGLPETEPPAPAGALKQTAEGTAPGRQELFGVGENIRKQAPTRDEERLARTRLNYLEFDAFDLDDFMRQPAPVATPLPATRAPSGELTDSYRFAPVVGDQAGLGRETLGKESVTRGEVVAESESPAKLHEVQPGSETAGRAISDLPDLKLAATQERVRTVDGRLRGTAAEVPPEPQPPPAVALAPPSEAREGHLKAKSSPLPSTAAVPELRGDEVGETAGAPPVQDDGNLPATDQLAAGFRAVPAPGTAETAGGALIAKGPAEGEWFAGGTLVPGATEVTTLNGTAAVDMAESRLAEQRVALGTAVTNGLFLQEEPKKAKDIARGYDVVIRAADIPDMENQINAVAISNGWALEAETPAAEEGRLARAGDYEIRGANIANEEYIARDPKALERYEVPSETREQLEDLRPPAAPEVASSVERRKYGDRGYLAAPPEVPAATRVLRMLVPADAKDLALVELARLSDAAPHERWKVGYGLRPEARAYYLAEQKAPSPATPETALRIEPATGVTYRASAARRALGPEQALLGEDTQPITPEASHYRLFLSAQPPAAPRTPVSGPRARTEGDLEATPLSPGVVALSILLERWEEEAEPKPETIMGDPVLAPDQR